MMKKMMMKRSLAVSRRWIVVLGALALGLVLSQGVAQAATCSGTGCNGLAPSGTTCNNDAYSISGSQRTFYNQFGTAIGTLVLRYSPSCKTVWSRVNSNYSKSAGIFQNGYYLYGASSSGAGAINTPMVYAPGTTMNGSAYLYLNSTTALYEQTPFFYIQ